MLLAPCMAPAGWLWAYQLPWERHLDADLETAYVYSASAKQAAVCCTPHCLPHPPPGPADSGRLALRRAVVAIHAAATGAEQPSGHPGMIAVAQAAQWMANRWVHDMVQLRKSAATKGQLAHACACLNCHTAVLLPATAGSVCVTVL